MDLRTNLLFSLIGVAGGLVLRALGILIRRRFGGRGRNAEVHLAAWLPVLLLEGALLWFAPDTIAWQLVALPLCFPAMVYALAVYSYWKRRDRPEEIQTVPGRLEKDAQREDRRRARIEAFKHGRRGGRDPQVRPPGGP